MHTASRVDRLVDLLNAQHCMPAKLRSPSPTPERVATTLHPGDDHGDGRHNHRSNVTCAHPSESTTESPASAPLGPTPVQVDARANAFSERTPPIADLNSSFDDRKGEPAPRGLSFSPFIAVTRYCYKFLPRPLGQQVATALFDGNKIYDQREWDLFVKLLLTY